ncbi:hypothetical protein GA0115246_101512 [Streptomyces sp. SolWspMP-sol7th]|nr:hypothetical protein GA0115246_101512 [Streptomyces sp. SolWspMP-sol7th]
MPAAGAAAGMRAEAVTAFCPAPRTQSVQSRAVAGWRARVMRATPLGRRITGSEAGCHATGAPSLAALSMVWL